MNNTTEEIENVVDKQFMDKVMMKCNKYRSNIKNEKNKIIKSRQELSFFLTDDEVMKSIQEYKDELNNSIDNNNNMNLNIDKMNILPSPPEYTEK